MKNRLSILCLACLAGCGNGKEPGPDCRAASECPAGQICVDQACADDPCDPDPCSLEGAVPGSCQPVEANGFSCECAHTFVWDGAACLQECIAEGDNAPVIVDAPPCCGDLIKVEIASPPQCIPIQGSVVCVAGPDGECGTGENECNVPEDCEPANCVAEGDTVDNTPGSPQCCSGLIKVEVADPPDCQADPDIKVCVAGVDGQCGPGESICNVPEDCS